MASTSIEVCVINNDKQLQEPTAQVETDQQTANENCLGKLKTRIQSLLGS